MGLSCFPPLWECWEHSRAGAVPSSVIFLVFFSPFSPLAVPCSGADVLGGHAAPEGDVSGQTWILSQRDVSRALSVEGNGSLRKRLGVQCLSCSLPPSIYPEQGARGTSSTFSCPAPPSVTGMQLPRCPRSWAGPGCSSMAIHGLWSLLYAVYIRFF